MCVKAHLHFKDAHLNYQRLKLGLTGNSTKGAPSFSSDRKHLFKVAHAIMITFAIISKVPQGLGVGLGVGVGVGSTASRFSASHGPHLVPSSPRNREENAPSRDRFPAAAGPGTNAPPAPRPQPGGGTGRRRRPAAQICAWAGEGGYGRVYISHARLHDPP